MSKSLILFRHAKSDWESDARTDHDRPLAQRGVDAAKRMGLFLKNADQLPEHILSSTAKRAFTTVNLAAKAGDWDRRIEALDTLYLADTGSVIEQIRVVPDEIRSLMLVGHEPTWSDLTSELIGGGDIRFPTAAMVRIKLNVYSWRGVRPGTGELSWLVKPRLIP